MNTPSGHLTYCTNIHAGESWPEHFAAIKRSFPLIKKQISPENAMGLGLRLSNQAGKTLIQKDKLADFKEWLKEEDGYVFTMNGFPYGGFHHQRVKDQVHTPDWTTVDRVNYTMRLFHILSSLVPGGMEGGISTSPLSYKPWFKTHNELSTARERCTKNILQVIEQLVYINSTTGVLLHLDIEPEPDGILETGVEFIEWFENELLPMGIPLIKKKFTVSAQHAEDLIREHLRLCYDVCHFAIGFEDHTKMIDDLEKREIKIGKIQISAALKARMDLSGEVTRQIRESFGKFNEPVYLHQVVAKKSDGTLIRYPDLPEALNDQNNLATEWRAHFHVPIFVDKFGLLDTTRDEIVDVLSIQKRNPFTKHLEVETYTWEVLADELKLPIGESISREMKWVQEILDSSI